MLRAVLVSLVGVLAIALAGCIPGMGGGGQVDQQFIDMMVPHHEGAIEMANIANERSNRPEIRQMAAAILRTQQAEIDQMKQWRQAWFGSPQTPPMERMPMMPGMGGAHAAHGGSMNMRQDVENLRRAPGDFDIAFIDAMIPNHQDAVDAAKILQSRTQRPEMKTLAEAIIREQEREITMMRQWRQAWTSSR